jgi:hypothetical protein
MQISGTLGTVGEVLIIRTGLLTRGVRLFFRVRPVLPQHGCTNQQNGELQIAKRGQKKNINNSG